MRNLHPATIAVAALLAAAGCGSTRDQAAPATVTGGTVTVAVEACTPCHGDATRSTTGADPLVQIAPPNAPSRNPADPAIGAHQAHLNDGLLARAVPCGSCHVVPSSVGSHQQPIVAFSGLSRTAWAGAPAIAPAFDAGTLSCSATYCHGAFPNGAAYAPKWGDPPAQCGSCHTVPPTTRAQGGTHPDVEPAACGRCHPGFTATAVDPALHVNGSVDTSFSCTSCHGDPARTGNDAAGQALAPAPPTDSHGSATSAAVGAHLTHLVTPFIASQPVACAECHAVPTQMDHANGVADVAFGPLARTAWAGQPAIDPTWDPGTLTCSSTYCHGNFPNGAGANPIAWNAPPGTASCGTCHGFPAVGGTHPDPTPANPSCSNSTSSCHKAVVNGHPDAATHLNGQVDFGP